MKYENTFKAIDQILWKEQGCGSELDYLEQKSWMLFLKYLDDLETEGAEFISTITPAEINKKYDSEIVISNSYKVTVYATKVGFIDSDKATIEIQASSSILGDVDGNGVVNVADHVKLSDIIMNKE